MKKTINRNSSVLMAFIGLSLLCTACKYQDVQPAAYPDQKLYMSTADVANLGPGGDGIYRINAAAVPGQVYRYTVDQTSKKFNVLLGVIRSGAYINGNANFSIVSTTDTITKLIASGKFPSDTQLLPASAFTLSASGTVASNTTSVTFPLVVDLNFLLSNPNKKYGLAVGITSTDRAVTPSLKTTLILIDTQFLIPTATFTAAANPSNVKLINFTNNSANGVSYSWDFGDGTAVSTLKTPTHTYAASGVYTVKLVTTGVTGDSQKAMFSASVTVL